MLASLMRLVLELALARSAGRLSRLAGRGGGTTLPGKILAAIDPTALSTLAGRLPQGTAIVSATNGKTTTALLVAAVLAPRIRLAHNRSGANLVSGVTSTLIEARDAELGLFEVDEGAFPDVSRRIRPRAVCLGNLFRDQLDRYGELEAIAERWQAAAGELPDFTELVVNADDPQVGDLATIRPGSVTFGLDDPLHARPSLQHAADSKYCLRCGTPYAYAAAYVGHLGDYRCPACGHGRPALDIAARAIELHGLDAVSFDLVLPEDTRRVRVALPGLYNVYNALAAAALARALGATPEEIAAGLAAARPAFGRAERIDMDGRSVLIMTIKNPAGANEVVRTLVAAGAPDHAMIALNDAIADGQDVSWIWDADLEPLLERLERLVVTGRRAAELALRCAYAGFPADRLEVVPDLGAALDRGLELTRAGGELTVLPTYTAMLALRKIVSERGYTRQYWERAATMSTERDRSDRPVPGSS
jgi:lipid II isoglutaminyl synthase (glutamine-hydrolysing)